MRSERLAVTEQRVLLWTLACPFSQVGEPLGELEQKNDKT